MVCIYVFFFGFVCAPLKQREDTSPWVSFHQFVGSFWDQGFAALPRFFHLKWTNGEGWSLVLLLLVGQMKVGR